MITILHGENIAVSRKELERVRQEFGGEVLILEGKDLKAEEFVQATQGNSLFGEKKLVIIENYLSGKKKADLDLESPQSDLVFWESKTLPKTTLDLFKNATIKEFKIPAVIFNLLDNLRPGNGKKNIAKLRECLKNEEPDYVFLMLVRQFRLMLSPDSVPPWQAAKIRAQAQSFGQEKLKEIYRQLSDLDFQYKQGLLPSDLGLSLELFLLGL